MPPETILYPDFGQLPPEAGDKVWVIEVPLNSGDFVLPDDALVIVECDKATLEVPSPKAGRIVAVHVKPGDTVTKNTPLVDLEPSVVSRQDFRADDDQLGETASTSVFLVHGHNEALREMAARLMEKLGLSVTILSEKPSSGDTIIEKLERNAAVEFAVVLMTGDDTGAKRGASTLNPRARQNVLLELGYFLGRIGRKRVCVLYEDGVELPSDYYGVVFIPIDSGGAWRYLLGKELKHAGLVVDLNRL
jgi:predicted nucleotide-binding protein